MGLIKIRWFCRLFKRKFLMERYKYLIAFVCCLKNDLHTKSNIKVVSHFFGEICKRFLGGNLLILKFIFKHKSKEKFFDFARARSLAFLFSKFR